MQNGKDTIYSQPQQVGEFCFDQSVAEVFPDMIQRSVPGYSTIVDTMGQICARYAKPKSNIYDLGCSLGAASLAVSKYVKSQNCQIIAIDNSPAMVHRCELHVQAYKSATPISVVCDDIQNIDIKNSIKLAEKLIKGQGRILVRSSGTESKIRVMGESNNIKLLQKKF